MDWKIGDKVREVSSCNEATILDIKPGKEYKWHTTQTIFVLSDGQGSWAKSLFEKNWIKVEETD